MKERFARKNEELIARLNAKKATPNQIKTYIDMAGSDPLYGQSFEVQEPLYPPTEEHIREKEEGSRLNKKH